MLRLPEWARWRKRRPQTDYLTNRLDRNICRAPFRLAVFADAAGATLQINVLRPLARAMGAGVVVAPVLTETDVARCGETEAEADGAIAAFLCALRPDVVFVSRYGGVGAGAIIVAARMVGAPVVFHLDDNLFAVPPEVGTDKARKYGDPARQTALRRLLAEASLVYLSTDLLRRQLEAGGQLARPAFVGAIASASDPLPAARSQAQDSPIVFGYMGSSSHGADLALALPAVMDCLGQHPDARFELFGTIARPAELEPFGARIAHHPTIADYDAFLHRLAELGWHFALAPLRDTPFNRAKTNTKWVEYAAAGIPAIFSEHPIYKNCCEGGAGMLVGDDGWTEAIESMLADATFRDSVRAKARHRVTSEYALVDLSRQLLDVFARAGVTVAPAAAAAILADGRTCTSAVARPHAPTG